jgi:hypothetical protein
MILKFIKDCLLFQSNLLLHIVLGIWIWLQLIIALLTITKVI